MSSDRFIRRTRGKRGIVEIVIDDQAYSLLQLERASRIPRNTLAHRAQITDRIDILFGHSQGVTKPVLPNPTWPHVVAKLKQARPVVGNKEPVRAAAWGYLA